MGTPPMGTMPGAKEVGLCWGSSRHWDLGVQGLKFRDQGLRIKALRLGFGGEGGLGASNVAGGLGIRDWV